MPPRKASPQQKSSPSNEVAPVERKLPEPIADEDRQKLSLASKLALVIGEVGNIEKKGRNDFHKYDYVRETDLVAAIGPLFSKYRIVILPSVDEISKNGEITRVTLSMTVINGDNPDERYDLSWAGEGQDRADKGLYKAYTGAIKYFLMKLLQVATGDDPEAFTKIDEQAHAVGSRSAPRRETVIEDSDAKPVQKGGRPVEGTLAQIQKISILSQALALGPFGLVDVVNRELGEQVLLPEDPGVANRHLADFLQKQDAGDLGRVAWALEEMLRQANAGEPEPAPDDPSEGELTPEEEDRIERAMEKASDEYAGGY